MQKARYDKRKNKNIFKPAMTQAQPLDLIEEIVSERINVFTTKNSVIYRGKIPSDGSYPLKDNFWYKIPDVVCVFTDLRGSTKFCAIAHEESTASVYEFFTGVAMKIFHVFGASYVDVKGDGAFALFNKDEVFRAFAAAISFKTFAAEKFKSLMEEQVEEFDIGFHIGIDQESILVKRVKVRGNQNKVLRKNEFWVGKPINMAAKLSSMSKDNELWVSDRFFSNLNGEELVMGSQWFCNEREGDEKVDLWKRIDLSDDDPFDFNKAYVTEGIYCHKHGKEWCEKILALDKKYFG
ncbi:MAG: hypothetical protein U9M90_00255 [Patescibacteria group bacterium]|nr:hypothetical protein [Patescibacteria group bacterium]